MPAFAYFIEKKQDIAHIELRNQGGTFVEDQEVIETNEVSPLVAHRSLQPLSAQ